MNYNISPLEKSKIVSITRTQPSEQIIDKQHIYLKKNQNQNNPCELSIDKKNEKKNSLSKLENKLKELESRIEFYKKHQDRLCDDFDNLIINKSVEIIEQIILNIDKNTIAKGRFHRNNKHIEFEF